MNIHLNDGNPDYDENRKVQTIEAAKKEYRRQMLSQPMSSWEFLFQQMLYLSKTYWITQIIVFLVSAVSLRYIHMGIGINKISYFAIYAPLLIIFSVPELWRNISANSYEVEGTTYFDLRKVYLARLVLVGMLDLILATILIAIMVNTSGFPLYAAVIYFFVPFNFNCCICFFLLCSKKRIYSEFIAAACCITEAVLWYLLVKNYHIYELLQMKTWYVLLILSFCYLIFAGKRIVETSRCYLEVLE